MSWYDAKNIADQLNYFWKRRGSVRTLIVLLLIFNFVIVIGSASVLYAIFDKLKLVSNPESLYRALFWSGLTWSFCNLILVGTWVYCRIPPRSSNQRTLVLFAPESEPECEETIFSLYRQFENDLKNRNLAGLVSWSLLPSSRTVRNHVEADRLLCDTGGRLVIYGTVERGNIKGKPVEGFKTISFTVRGRQLQESEILPVVQTLGGAMALRSFVFQDSNSFIEKTLVVKNLSEVACFFIAVALTLDGEVERSLEILETLLVDVELKRKRDHRQPQLELFYRSIVDCLRNALMQKFHKIYELQVRDNITMRAVDEYCRECDRILERFRKLPTDPREVSLLKAIICFHFGDVDEAKKGVSNAKAFEKNDLAPYLSSAFLRLWDGTYRSALQEYMRAKRCSHFDQRVVLSVLAFFDSILKIRPEKKQLRFGLAFVNDWFFDSRTAIIEYNRFLDDTELCQDNGIELLREHVRVRYAILRTSSGWTNRCNRSYRPVTAC